MGKIVRLTESELINVIQKIVKEDAFGTGFKAGKEFKQDVKNVVKKGVEVVSDAMETIVKIGTTVLKFTFTAAVCVVYIGVQGFKLAAELGKKVLSFLGSLAKKVGGIVVGGAKKAANFTKNMISKAVGGVVSFFTTLFDLIKKLGMKAYAAALMLAKQISDVWKYISSWATAALSKAWDATKKFGKDVYNKAASAVGDAWDTAKDIGAGVGGFFSGIMSESELKVMLQDYKYYNSLPLTKMINEIRIDTRQVIY